MIEHEAALTSLEDGVVLFDSNDELVFLNPAFRRMTAPASSVFEEGMERAMIENLLSWQGIYEEAGIDALRQAIDALLDDGVTDTAPFDIALVHGGWHEIRLALLRDDVLMITCRDVSADRIQRAELNESEALLRQVMMHAPANLIVYDLDTDQTLFQSPNSVKLMGEVTGRISNTWANPDDRSAYLVELLATGQVDRFETLALRADGSAFPSQISVRMFDHGGRRLFVSFNQDMTVPYAQRDAVRQSRQRLLDAIEALDQGFALYDTEDRLVMCNAGFRSVNAQIGTGIEADAALDDLRRAALAAGHPVAALGCLAEGDTRQSFQLPDGRDFVVSRLSISDGGTVVVLRDVTAERELVRRREAAFQSEKMSALGELLAGVAHELNNPLSVVVGQSLMLSEEVTDPGPSRRIAKLSRAAERCARIVKTFLAMARQKPLSPVPSDVNEIAQTAIDVAEMGPHAGDIHIVQDLGRALPAVRADQDQLTQVLVNLLLNAMHALDGQKGGEIALSTGVDDARDQVWVRVTDNGPGIPPENRARIFEPFFTTKDVDEGTGVGLALCRQIVTAHGGTIVLDETETGAAFLIRFPAITERADDAPHADAPAPARTTVLVVEDEADVAEIICDILTGDGVDAVWAPDGAKALHVLAQRRFDAVLCDLRMPGMTGRELLRKIADAFPDMLGRTGFITGDTMSSDAEAIRQEIGSKLIEKPVAPREVRELLRRLIEGETG